MSADLEHRIEKALDFCTSGQVDGGHHKAWAIDQIVRALTGCPDVVRTSTDINDVVYTWTDQGESPEYVQFVADYCADEDGPDSYSWDEGCPP